MFVQLEWLHWLELPELPRQLPDGLNGSTIRIPQLVPRVMLPGANAATSSA